MAASASVLTNKYSEGYPGRRYYGGNRIADEVEDLARERLKELFGAEHANVSLMPARGQPGRLPGTRRARATPSWPCASTRAAISPMARRCRSPASSTVSSPTASRRRRRTAPASGSTWTWSATWPSGSGRGSSSPARRPIPARSTRCRSARSPTRSGRGSCSTPPTRPASSPPVCTRTRSGWPMSSPSPPTRHCGAHAAAPSSAGASSPGRSTPPSSPACRVARSST